MSFKGMIEWIVQQQRILAFQNQKLHPTCHLLNKGEIVF